MNVYKGVAAGVAGGLVGSLAMNQFQSLWSRLMENEERPHGASCRFDYRQPHTGEQR